MTTSSVTGAAAQSAAPATSTAATAANNNQNMFLQLLVSQLQNQNPLNPTDGTQFVTELAQFQQLDTTLTMGQDIGAIRQDLDRLVAASAGASTRSEEH